MGQGVLFVDDEPDVVEGMKDALRREPYMVFGATSAAEALARLAQGGIEVLVTDDQMPDMRGFELAALVHERYPDVATMILTGKAALESAIQAINRGQVFRYLTKPCSPETLREALRGAFQHRALRAVSSRILEFSRTQVGRSEGVDPAAMLAAAAPVRAAAREDDDPVLRLSPLEREALSPREKEILRAVVLGKRPSELARSLFISVHTARNHVKTIYKKLQVHSRAELLTKLR